MGSGTSTEEDSEGAIFVVNSAQQPTSTKQDEKVSCFTKSNLEKLSKLISYRDQWLVKHIYEDYETGFSQSEIIRQLKEELLKFELPTNYPTKTRKRKKPCYCLRLADRSIELLPILCEWHKTLDLQRQTIVLLRKRLGQYQAAEDTEEVLRRAKNYARHVI